MDVCQAEFSGIIQNVYENLFWRYIGDVKRYSQPHIIEIMPTAIESRQKSTNPPATIVVIIASSLRRSNMIPIIPTIKEETIEKITIGPTRATKGLPQPG